MWQNSKTQIAIQLKTQNITKHIKTSCDKTLSLKFWLHSKTQIMAKFNDLNSDKTLFSDRTEN